MPERIQLRRVKGYRKPEGAVVVDRRTKWGNPVPVGRVYDDDPNFPAILALTRWPRPPFGRWGSVDISPAVAVDAYFEFIVNAPDLWLAARDELAGRDLACWCPLDAPCHADVLLEVANS